MNVLQSDPAAIMQAAGLVAAYAAGDDDHINAVIRASMKSPAAMGTFSGLVWLAAALADELGDVPTVLADILGSTSTPPKPREVTA